MLNSELCIKRFEHYDKLKTEFKNDNKSRSKNLFTAKMNNFFNNKLCDATFQFQKHFCSHNKCL